jgi:hypothetical protein
MIKKYLFSVLIPIFIFLALIFSVANAEFNRTTGESGWGYGYGWGYGQGYGFESGAILGYKISTDPSDSDVYGYGFGYGYLPENGSFDLENGLYEFSNLDMNILSDGHLFVFGLNEEGPLSGTMSEASYIITADNLILPVVSGVTVDIPIFTVILASESVDFSSFSGGSTATDDLSVSGSVLSSFQFGLPDQSLLIGGMGEGEGASLDQSLTITFNVNVDTVYNGDTLSIYHKSVGGSWSLLDTCVVSGGICSFEAGSLSSFAVVAPATSSVANPVSTGGGLSRAIVPEVNNSTTTTNKFVTRGNCYRLENGKIQLLAKSSCYLRTYNKKTKKYLTLLKPNIEYFSRLVRIGKKSTIYAIDGKCRKELVISNWRLLVSRQRVVSLTAKNLNRYPLCEIAK